MIDLTTQLPPIINAFETLEANPVVEAVYVASHAKLYAQQLKDGQLSPAECADLLADLPWDETVMKAALTEETYLELTSNLTALKNLVSSLIK